MSVSDVGICKLCNSLFAQESDVHRLRIANNIILYAESVLSGMTASNAAAKTLRYAVVQMLEQCCPGVEVRDSICDILAQCRGTRGCVNLTADVMPCMLNLAVFMCSTVHRELCVKHIVT